MTAGIELFFSYSHQDEALRDELAKHLSLLQRQQVIQAWHDRQITAGSNWAGQIDQRLEQAKIILLLISADFLASPYCYDVELKRAVERHRAGQAVVIPVILRPVDWQGASFSSLQALPKNARPVTTWENRDEALLDIAQGIRRVATQLAEAAPVLQSQLTSPNVSAQTTNETESALTPIAPLELPDGQVPLESPFYIERSPIETDCFEGIVTPSALIRIKAPRQVGKSSLLARILDYAEQQGYRSVHLSFQEAEEEVFETLSGLLRWLSASIAYGLGLPAQFEQYWTEEPLSNKQKCSNYLENYIFPQVLGPLVLGLDEVDRVFQYPKIASDFFGLLRAWHDAKKNNPVWKNLRLIITHSQEVYVPLNINQSPFNVGQPVELPEFTAEQVDDLARRHGLALGLQLPSLMQMLGGHPYLIRVALYALAKKKSSLSDLLTAATTQTGPYGDHLRHHLENLADHAALQAAMRTVVRSEQPVPIAEQAAFKLRSMGLIRQHGDLVEPLGDLYRLYFRDRL